MESFIVAVVQIACIALTIYMTYEGIIFDKPVPSKFWAFVGILCCLTANVLSLTSVLSLPVFTMLDVSSDISLPSYLTKITNHSFSQLFFWLFFLSGIYCTFRYLELLRKKILQNEYFSPATCGWFFIKIKFSQVLSNDAVSSLVLEKHYKINFYRS